MSEAPTPAPVKPGYKTSEFLLSAVTVVLNALYVFLQDRGETGQLTTALAMGLAVLSALGYTAFRSSVKRGSLPKDGLSKTQVMLVAMAAGTLLLWCVTEMREHRPIPAPDWVPPSSVERLTS